MAAHRHDAAARAAHVAQQQLQDRRRADHLHAGRVLGPAQGVHDAPVRSRPEFAISGSATSRNCSCVQPQVSATISGV